MTSETVLSEPSSVDDAGQAAQPAEAVRPATPFHSLDHYIALPRLSTLALSADGNRLVTAVGTLSAKGTEYTTALWELDPAGQRPARRITRSAKGEAGAAFLRNGDLLFTSARPDPDMSDADAGNGPVAALWKIPAAGGEGRVVLSRPGGIAAVQAARDADTVTVTAPVLAGSADEDDDAARRKARQERKVGAILHSGYPVRFWDQDLGPGQARHFVLEPAGPGAGGLDPSAAAEAADADPGLPGTIDAEPALKLLNITPDAGAALLEAGSALSPDGRTLLTGYRRPLARGDSRSVLAAVDTATGARRILLDSEDAEYQPGPVSPDNRRAVVVRELISGPDRIPDVTLGLVSLSDGGFVPLAADWDRWPHPAGWLPDGSAVVVTADEDGRTPVFLIDTASGTVRRVTGDDAAYTDVVVSPDGRYAYALRSSYRFPPEPVRIDLASGGILPLPSPAARPQLPGRLEEVETTVTANGTSTRVRGWLALPADASAQRPAPLLLWVHGGPLSSWNAWSWRWCPWILVACGYAVLLPDPALSTGYGKEFVRRGWGRWGQEPFTDLMAITDEAERRPDIDSSRTAAMGGSFGGYMANWIAGHTDRFRAIVTHASLWALDQFGPTTDVSTYWEKEMTAERAEANSPHRHVEEIRTPMLVIHGDKDYRVPVGEGLRLWYELLSRSGLPADENGDTVHRFLYFPDENHWVLSPQHARVWYSVVENFLARHVLGQETGLPAELGL
ncbi:prolyl oligopeptidase family serine peptidase [Arthrobacter sp. I2-34]|uniref:Prolyl oligopeptidase family serine peptidase n=1 Tax=Arthrobacter hankyongi TaxID=2904801 RepID=A0ABS9LC40_9MICC|nr:prolyl oligopeptidase family serine peptidase [Arthrobacter hankyongi]MCG2624248.1 prolyl oligopeptidase family serine peptidase [Arthrobacter hankyongi]